MLHVKRLGRELMLDKHKELPGQKDPDAPSQTRKKGKFRVQEVKLILCVPGAEGIK